MADKLKALEDLPELEDDPFFREIGDPPTEVPVYHIALIHYGECPAPKKIAVTGLSASGNLVFGSPYMGWGTREQKLIAEPVNGTDRSFMVDHIKKYEVIVSHETITQLKQSSDIRFG